MTSLFTSFDLSYFYLQFLFFFMFLFFSYNNLFYFTLFKKFYFSIKIFMENFFMSLKPSSFSKFYFEYLWILMIFIFFLNFSSILPFNFSLTSQVSVVFFLSLMSWSIIMYFNIFGNFKGVLMHFVPEGTPIYLTWFLFGIEMVSSLIRPLTLTVRLVANILAGHLLIILLSKLVFLTSPVFFFFIFLNLVELFVSLIQSYIFSTMICLYFSEI